MIRLLRLSFLASLLCVPRTLFCQAMPTARRTLQISAFGLLGGTYTGLSGGRNLAVTAGGDLIFLHYRKALFGAELRGTYPLDKGAVDSQKSVLAGLRAETRVSRVVVFGDVLAGRGGIDYQNGGYPVPPLVYFATNTVVYAAGGGAELDITRQLALKLDAQVQHWATPVTASGVIYPKQIGVGVVYRFGANGRPLLGVRD